MPTTNPVPSQDPSDLLFNAGKLDEVLNGTGNSFTDRLGNSRRTVAGMNADFDAQLADAESDLNVYRAEAAASAAEALGYLQTIRATSYGAYASDPATDPLGNPPTVGDEYFNTTANLLKRWNGTTWQASDINTANLAASSGSSLVGYDAGTVQDVLDGAKSLQDYAALRAYTGRAKRIYITGLLVTKKPAGIAGVFQLDPTDTTSTDNGGTIIVDANGGRWKRDFLGAVHLMWFGSNGMGTNDDTAAVTSAVNTGFDLFVDSGFSFKVTSTTTVTSTQKRKIFGSGRLIQGANDINIFDCSTAKNLTITEVEFQGYAATAAGTDFTKNQAVYASSGRNITVKGCSIHGFSHNGIQLRNVFSYRIEENTFYDNYYDSPSGSDILIYSNIAGARGTIRGNYCHSNNSQAIYVNAVGGDRDVIVDGNVCHTINYETGDELTLYSAAAGTIRNSTEFLQRRHGIVFGYSAVSAQPGRLIVTNNNIRSTQWTGIYRPASSVDPGPATVTENIMSNVSMQDAASGSLEGGLLILACGSGDIYDSNQILSVGNGNPNKAGIKFTPSVGFSGSARITKNTVNGAAMGIWIGGYLQERVVISENDLYNFHQRGGIYYAPSASNATINSTISIKDNLIDGFNGSTYDRSAIYLDFGSPAIPQIIEVFAGSIHARADTSYFGVSFKGLGSDDTLEIGGGISIDGAENAVWNDDYAVGRLPGLRLGRVIVRNGRNRATCEAFNMGYNGGANGSAFALVEAGGGVYQGVTKVIDNRGGAKALYQGVWLDNDRVEVVHTGIPTTGCWVRGDRVVYESPSGSAAPGAVCVTGGQFGTLSGITAATTAGSTTVTFSSVSGLAVGMFITIAGVTGTKRIVTLSGTSATVDSNCDATVASGAVAYVTPVFKAMSSLTA